MGDLIVSNRFNNNIERTGKRDMAYSRWHRTVDGAAYVDIDSVEMCRACQQPIAFIELARDVGQDIFGKRAHVTRHIANKMELPAFIVFYKLDSSDEITEFRAIKIAPSLSQEQHFTVEQWGAYLLQLQTEHQQSCDRNHFRKNSLKKVA